nr:Uncharacterised protein [Klebsiella pneumoniae]
MGFRVFFAAFGNVVNISNIFTKLLLNHFAIFSVLPVSLPKKMPMIAMSKITS